MRLGQVWTEQSLIQASASTFFLMTQVALASRTTDWEAALGRHGISLPPEASVFDLTVEVQAAIDRYVGRSSAGATDLSEIAQQSAGEAILTLAGMRTGGLFGGGSADTQNAMRPFSTKKGFGELGQQFFGRFVGALPHPLSQPGDGGPTW